LQQFAPDLFGLLFFQRKLNVVFLQPGERERGEDEWTRSCRAFRDLQVICWSEYPSSVVWRSLAGFVEMHDYLLMIHYVFD